MTTLLVDTSVLIKWFHSEGESQVAEARALRNATRRSELETRVIDLALYEMANVLLRSLHWSGSDVADQLDDPIVICGSPLAVAADWLRQAAVLGAANRMTLYDACWAAAAEALGISLHSSAGRSAAYCMQLVRRTSRGDTDLAIEVSILRHEAVVVRCPVHRPALELRQRPTRSIWRRRGKHRAGALVGEGRPDLGLPLHPPRACHHGVVVASSVWAILKRHAADPAPRRSGSGLGRAPRRTGERAHGRTGAQLVACDFFRIDTVLRSSVHLPSAHPSRHAPCGAENKRALRDGRRARRLGEHV